jgi:hypothetical protein
MTGQEDDAGHFELGEQHFGHCLTEFCGTEKGFHNDDFPVPGIHRQVREVNVFDKVSQMSEKLISIRDAENGNNRTSDCL